MIALGLYLLTG